MDAIRHGNWWRTIKVSEEVSAAGPGEAAFVVITGDYMRHGVDELFPVGPAWSNSSLHRECLVKITKQIKKSFGGRRHAAHLNVAALGNDDFSHNELA